MDAGSDITICSGEAVTLSGSGAGVGGTYAWDGGVMDGISFTPATTATYNLIVTSAEGCTGTDAVTITVNPMPVINGGADLTICSGQFVTLSGSGAGIGGTYLWDGGVINAVAFAPLSTATYTVTGTTAAGCTATDAVTVTVNTSPTVNFTADETAGCKPFTVNFTSGSIGATFYWAFGD